MPGRVGKRKKNSMLSTCDQNNEPARKQLRTPKVSLENEMLIEEVKGRRALWVRSHPDYHQNSLTLPLWEEIAKDVDMSVENLRRRWKNLKDHYRKELKKTINRPNGPHSQWPYFKKMKFMKAQMFLSLRRKNGEEHLEIMSEDDEIDSQYEERSNSQKQEGIDPLIDDYEDEYNDMFKMEEAILHNPEISMNEEIDNEDETQRVNELQQIAEDEVDEDLETQEAISVATSLASQDEELVTIQGRVTQDIPRITNISSVQQNITNLNPVKGQEQRSLSNISRAQQRHNDHRGVPTIQQITEVHSLPMLHRALNGKIFNRSQNNNSLDNRNKDNERINVNARPMTTSSGRTHCMQTHVTNMSGGTNSMVPEADMSDEVTCLRTNSMSGRIVSPVHQLPNVQDKIIHQVSSEITLDHRTTNELTRMSRGETSNRSEPVDTENSNNLLQNLEADDYHFFMSLVPHVRHFSSLQKLKVRNKIQQIIIEESLNCQFDPLGNC